MKSILRFFFGHPTAAIALALLVGIGCVVGYDVVARNSDNTVRFSPYVVCNEGTTVVKRAEKRISLGSSERASIFEGDQIKTLPNSKATVYWVDGSATRLSEKTSIDVAALANDPDSGRSRVDFSLSEGKTWSRTYRYLDNGSEFTERFDGGTKIAAVRGTAFEINADKGYLRTESHAVEVLDRSGKSLATVAEGSAVSTSTLQDFVNSGLDKAWKEWNLAEDAKYSVSLMLQAKEEILSSYSASKSAYERVRAVFVPEEPLPVTLSFSGDTLSVGVPENVASKVRNSQTAYAKLLSVYEKTAKLSQTAENIRAKESLREAIIELAPESEKAALATRFARHGTYDSWAAAAAGNRAEWENLRAGISKFVAAGADAKSVEALEKALPAGAIDRFNAKGEEIKTKAVDALTDPNLLVPTKEELEDAAKKVFDALSK